MSKSMTFDEWVASVFDHPVTEPAWYWDSDASFWDGPGATVVEYMTRLFRERASAKIFLSDGDSCSPTGRKV